MENRRGTNLNKPVKEKISLFFSSSSLFSSTLKQTTQKTRFFSHSLSSFSPLSSSSRLLSRNLFFSTLSSLKCSRTFSPSLKKFSLRLPKSSLSSLSSLRRNLSPHLFLFSLSLGHVLAEEERERKENDLEKERERKEEEEETIFEEREKICAESTESALYWILQMIAKDGLWWLATALFAVAGAVTGMMIPKSIAQLLDIARTLAPNGEGQVAPDLSVLYSPAAKVGGLFLLESICNFCFFSCLSSSSLRLEARMRTSVFAHLLRQDIAQFDQIRIGEFVSTASSDVEQVRMACKESIALGLRNCLRVGGYIYVLYSTSSKLTFALSLMIPTVISAGTLYARFLRSLSKTIQNATAHETAMMEEVLGNVRTVRSFANEDEEEERFLERLSLTKDLRSKFGIFIGGFQSSSSFAINGLAMIVFCYGGSLVFSGEMTVGQLTSFIMYANNLQRALSKLSILFGHISKASGSASRILELLRMGPMIPVKGGMVIRDRDEFWRNLSLASKMQTPQERERGEGEGVEFEGVFFQYPSRPEAQVLSDISLNLKPGSVTALVGMSGSGKSTMAALLQRFYDPTEGKIYVNGIDIKRLDPTWWRNGIGVVGQEPVLFSCSIADNIRYGKPDATHQEIMEAAKMANCHEFISEFRDGYDTPVGERGAQLSGGQRQRIAIARAILKDPQILILDEATSALDAKSEECFDYSGQAVQNALDKLMEHRTVLVIAHRLSTIQSADCIVVMQGGKILEKGKHTDLLSKDGNYADLIRSQVSSPTEDQ